VTVAFPTLIISRRPRHVGSGWDDARSWVGGEPQLGGQPWPRGGARQTPFYFLAQIDLAEVEREVGRWGRPTPLTDGALAFFIGPSLGEEWDCAVVHVPRPGLGEPTPPPPDAPAVLEPGGDIFPAAFAREDPRLFPRWPVDVTSLGVDLEVAPDADEEEQAEALEAIGETQVAAVERLFTRRQFFFTAKAAYEMIGDAPRPFWWHSAHHYAACLRTALRHVSERVEGRRQHLEAARVAELERTAAEFERFVREVADWVRGTDPWQLMPPEAVEALASTFERGKTDFPDFTRFYTPYSLDDLETETLLALATAEDRAYATVPETVRSLINTQYLLPTQNWHQMFGRGVDIQADAACDNEGNVMLLQLVYDDMTHWRFGDMGAFQFWIPPDDLAGGNWAAVRVTFECG
jgi:hypothetical protein